MKVPEVRLNETPILLNEKWVGQAMKRLEVTNEYVCLRELLDALILQWLRTTPIMKEKSEGEA